MDFVKIHLIYPISNSAEEEYMKKFLRIIGCMVYPCSVNNPDLDGWFENLYPCNEPGGVDIVMNFYGEDIFSEECTVRNIRRIYMYYDPMKEVCAVREEPVEEIEMLSTFSFDAFPMDNAISQLIQSLWKDEPEIGGYVAQIYDLYSRGKGELYYLLQARRCLKVLSMGEVLQNPDTRVPSVFLSPYIQKILGKLSEFYYSLEKNCTIYSSFSRVFAVLAMWRVMEYLHKEDQDYLLSDESLVRIVSYDEVKVLLDDLLEQMPASVSVLLLYAKMCRYGANTDWLEERIYSYIQSLIPINQKGYAYIWYRIGQYFEKRKGNIDRAKAYYRRAIQTDRACYQAAFKFGYFSALDGEFQEAEKWLTNVLNIISRGLDMSIDYEGEDHAWGILSLKECQYAFKVNIWLAKIGINSNREYLARTAIGGACLAATYFENANLEQLLSRRKTKFYEEFIQYHRYSKAVWVMWKLLSPWSERIIKDDFIRGIVESRLYRWEDDSGEQKKGM